MAIKSLKEKKSTTPNSGIEKSSKADPKTSKKKGLDEEDDLDEEEVNDDWGKEEEDTNWDPDFEEFDMPKKASKKPGKFKVAEEEDDFSLNEDFKEVDDDDLFEEKDELDDY
jgi:hypothetical protein